MQAKIIEFPKRPDKFYGWYYFKHFYHVVLQGLAAWTLVVFSLIYDHLHMDLTVFAGITVWTLGSVMLLDFTYYLGIKRKQRQEENLQNVWQGNRAKHKGVFEMERYRKTV